MIKWFKRDGDEKLPSKKEDQLARFYATSNRQDLPAPLLPDALPPLNDNLTNSNAAGEFNEPDPDSYGWDDEEAALMLLAAGINHAEDIAAAAVSATSV
jgi:hypothetical protein